MKKRIFASFINIVALLVMSLPVLAQGQKQEIKLPKEVFPLYNGTFVGVDLYGLGSKAFGSNFLSSEVSVDVNLRNRFFPVLEVGYGKTDAEKNSISYKSSAPYFRIGMNYNMMFRKKSMSHLYLGARYGFSVLSYDVKGPALEDDIYSGEVPSFEYTGEKTNAHWMELLFGIRAQIHKNFLMGWSLRYKAKLSIKENASTTPWYIPGFGENKSTNFGVTYSLIYKLPF
jgi:hypothetical protein